MRLGSGATSYINAVRKGMKPNALTGGHIIADTNWSDPTSIVACAQTMLSHTEYKDGIEREAYRNLAFLAGLHWHKWSGDRRLMEKDFRRDPDLVYMTINWVAMAMEIKLGKMLGNRRGIEWKPDPASDDDDDIELAKTQADILTWYYESVLTMPAAWRKAILMAIVMKSCFFEVMWDGNAGDRIIQTPQDFSRVALQNVPPGGYQLGGSNGQVMPWMIDANGEDGQFRGGDADFDAIYGADQKAMRQRQAFRHTGDVRVEVFPLMQYFVWPTKVEDFADTEIEARVTMETATRVADELSVPVERIRNAKITRDSKHRSWLGQQSDRELYGLGGKYEAEELDDMIEVVKLFRKPCASYPEGAKAIVIGDDAFGVGPNPYPQGKSPFVQLRERLMPGCPWGACTMDDLIDPQRDLNAAMSQRVNYRNRKINPTIIEFPNAAASPNEKLTNKPGGRYKVVSRDMAPFVLEMPNLGVDHEVTIRDDIRMLETLSGTTSIDQGGQPGNDDRSGRAIGLLTRANSLKDVTFGELIDTCSGEIGTRVLDYVMKFLKDPRRVTAIVGDYKRREVMRFTGESLRPSNYDDPSFSTKIKVVAWRKVPLDPAELRATLTDAVASGMLNPADPDDKRHYWEMLSVGDDRLVKQKDRDNLAAEQEEIDNWRRGKSVPLPDQSESHAARVEYLERWIVTSEYRDCTAQFPQLAQEIEQHRLAHYQGEAVLAIRPAYDQQDADITLWKERRAHWINTYLQEVQALAMQMVQRTPGLTPQDAMMQARTLIPNVADLFYGAPIGLAAASAARGVGQKGGGSGSDRAGEKSGSSGREKGRTQNNRDGGLDRGQSSDLSS